MAADDTAVMDSPLVVGIAVVIVLVVVRQFAARRVLARQGQFVWLMFVSTLIGGVVILSAGIQILATAPIVGAPMAVGGAVYLAVVARFLTRASSSVSAAGPNDDIGSALTEPMVDYLSTIMGLVLIGGLLAMVGVIAWGVTQAR
jgi:hypothetical protein